MKIEFRFHRGGLDESLKTIVMVRNLDELALVINIELQSCFEIQPVLKSQLKVKSYGIDERINWDTHIVSIDHEAYKGVIGFLNGSFIDEELDDHVHNYLMIYKRKTKIRTADISIITNTDNSDPRKIDFIIQEVKKCSVCSHEKIENTIGYEGNPKIKLLMKKVDK